MVSPSQVRGSVRPLASIRTFKRIRVFLRDSRAPGSGDIMRPAFASLKKGSSHQIRTPDGTSFCRTDADSHAQRSPNNLTMGLRGQSMSDNGNSTPIEPIAYQLAGGMTSG